MIHSFLKIPIKIVDCSSHSGLLIYARHLKYLIENGRGKHHIDSLTNSGKTAVETPITNIILSTQQGKNNRIRNCPWCMCKFSELVIYENNYVVET